LTEDAFDWNPLGEAWWRDAARQLGASDKQTMFAAAKFRGCSNTQAAKEARYTATTDAGLRTTGYRLARANIIERLLAFAAGEGGGADGSVTRDEGRRILSSLARGSDPSVRIRAIEQLAKFDEADRHQRPATSLEPREISIEILREIPRYGPGILADTHFDFTGQLFGMPFLKELAPLLRRDFPIMAALSRRRAGEAAPGLRRRTRCLGKWSIADGRADRRPNRNQTNR
jgi:hypothetical protein